MNDVNMAIVLTSEMTVTPAPLDVEYLNFVCITDLQKTYAYNFNLASSFVECKITTWGPCEICI
jgi:hypothetical protein